MYNANGDLENIISIDTDLEAASAAAQLFTQRAMAATQAGDKQHISFAGSEQENADDYMSPAKR